MSDFSIRIDGLTDQLQNLKQYRTNLSQINESIESVKSSITIGEDFVQALQRCQNDISVEIEQLSSFGTALEQIIIKYTETEKKLMGDESETQLPEVVGKDEEYNQEEKKLNLDELTAETLGISEEAWEIIKFILGFIPVVNCIMDFYQIASDLNEAFSDGHLSMSERAGILVDIAFLGLDIFSAKQIINGIKGITKTVKLAKIESKAASETAKKLAEKAAKEAAKTGGTVPTTKAAQKATKAAKKATKAAKKAEEAAKVSKETSRAAAKSVSKDLLKAAAHNVKDEYIGSDKSVMPYAIIREQRDAAIQAG